MALLPILEFPDPRLRTRAEPVQQFDAALRQLVADMLQTMYAAPGIGLAATQVNIHRQLLVMDISNDLYGLKGQAPNVRRLQRSLVRIQRR